MLSKLCKFLDENPSETVTISTKQEDTDDGNIWKPFMSAITPDIHYWYDNKGYTGLPPSLAAAHGKILFFSVVLVLHSFSVYPFPVGQVGRIRGSVLATVRLCASRTFTIPGMSTCCSMKTTAVANFFQNQKDKRRHASFNHIWWSPTLCTLTLYLTSFLRPTGRLNEAQRIMLQEVNAFQA